MILLTEPQWSPYPQGRQRPIYAIVGAAYWDESLRMREVRARELGHKALGADRDPGDEDGGR